MNKEKTIEHTLRNDLILMIYYVTKQCKCGYKLMNLQK